MRCEFSHLKIMNLQLEIYKGNKIYILYFNIS